jgi:hypothetical protein
MLIDTDPDVFGLDVPVRPVLALINLMEIGRHDWLLSRNALLAADEYLEAKLGMKESETEYIYVNEKLKAAFNQPGASAATREPVRVTASCLVDVLADLSSPAVVMVENSLNDGAYLMWHARLLNRDRIIDASQQQWLRFANAGGSGSIEAHTIVHCQTFRQVIRVVMIMDGDWLREHEMSQRRQKLAKAIEQGAIGHIWTGRDIENFISGHALAHPKDKGRAPWIEALSRLPWLYRSKMDMKRGLPKDDHRQKEEVVFFAGVPDVLKQALQRGWSPRTAEEWDATPATEEDLADLPEEARREIQHVMDLIERIL